MKESYRKVSDHLWTDARFMAFDTKTKLLWLYLLTSPHAHSIPGLFRAGLSEIEADTGLSHEDCQSAWETIAQSSMAKADWRSRLIWLPNAIRHNLPDNPSVLQAWARRLYTTAPECELRDEAARRAVAHITKMGGDFAQACRSLFPDLLRSGRPSATAEKSTRMRQTYRRVFSNRLWADQKFSAMPQASKLLWLYFLTGPNQSAIPGLFRCNVASAAQDIGIDPGGPFSAAWQPISDHQMAIANWERRLIWLPQALRYGWPQKAEVLVEWGRTIDTLPECDERDQAKTAIQKMARQSGDAFIQAYKDGFLSKQEPLSLRYIGYTKRETQRSQKPIKPSNGSHHQQANGLPHRSATVRMPEIGNLFPGNTHLIQTITEKNASYPQLSDRQKDSELLADSMTCVTVQPFDATQPNGSTHPPLHTEYRIQTLKDKEKDKDALSNSLNPTPAVCSVDPSNSFKKDDKPTPSRNAGSECPESSIIDLYHHILPMLPKVIKSRWMTSVARTHLHERWSEGFRPRPDDVADWFAYQSVEAGLAAWKRFFEIVREAPLLIGQGTGRQWHADFRWLIKRENFTKTLEGRYDAHRDSQPSEPSQTVVSTQQDDAEFERFCAIYPPHRLRRDHARIAWANIMKSGEDTAKIVEAAAAWARSADWLNEAGRYVPNASKWLSEQRWKVTPPSAARITPESLSAKQDDGYSRFKHHVSSPKKSTDHRVMRFKSGLYLLGEDCLILNDEEGMDGLYNEVLASMAPFGQIVDVDESKLPRRVVRMIEDQRNGWYQSLGDECPLLDSELPAFPETYEHSEI